MTLFNLLSCYNNNEIFNKLIELYPDQIGARQGYERTFLELRKYKNKSKCDNKYLISVDLIPDDDYFPEDGYVHVHLKDKKSLVHFGILGDFQNMMFYEIENNIENLDELSLCAHIIFELTYYGFTSEEVNKTVEKWGN